MRNYYTIAFVFISLSLFGQTSRIDSLLTDLFFTENEPVYVPQKPVKYDFIYAGTNISSNTFYAGRQIEPDMKNVTAYTYYYNHTGLYAGLTGIWYDHQAPGYSSTRLLAGFNKSIGNKRMFFAKTSYSRILYYMPDTSYNYPYKNNVSLGFTFRKKWIGARIYSSYLFGKDFRYGISSAVYSKLTLYRFKKYNKVYSNPEISAYYSTERISTRDFSTIGTNLDPGWEDVYGLLNTQLYFPIGISVGRYDIEFTYSLNLPTTKDVNLKYPVKPYYFITIGYILPVKRAKRPWYL